MTNNQNLIKSPNPLAGAGGSGIPLPESEPESKPEALVDAERFIYALNKRTAAERKTIDPVPDGELFTAWEVFQMLQTHHAYVVECALNASLDESASLSSMKTLAEKLVALEAENSRLREALWQAEPCVEWHYQDTLSTRAESFGEGHSCNPEAGCDGLCQDVHSARLVSSLVHDALSAQTPTTGILELAAAGYALALALDNPACPEDERILKSAEALSPEVKAMLEGLN